MKFKFLFNKFFFLFVIILPLFQVSFAQKGPRQEKLLNGLKVLMWTNPAVDKVSLKVRIHSGSAFDPQGKEGVMKLLADNIFPQPSAKEFFIEDLGGSLDITSNYDYIQVSATANSDQLLPMLEAVAGAVSNPTIDKETTATLRSGLLEKVAALEKDPAYVADRAAANRLFGTFPYGRPEYGTTETLKKLDFADLIFVKGRFLSADNATITLTGKFNSDLAYRAIRRYFGAWLKSDNRVPSTFRQPDEPDTKPLTISPAGVANNSEAQYLMRGLARSDKDFPAAKILERILAARLENLKPGSGPYLVSHDGHVLPGSLLISYKISESQNSADVITRLFAAAISEDEFAKANALVQAERNQKPVDERWLDVDTFSLASVKDEDRRYQSVTLVDVQRVASRLSKNPVVTVIVKP